MLNNLERTNKMKILSKICNVKYANSTGETKIYTVIRANKSHQDLMVDRFKNKNPEDYIVVRGMNKNSKDFMTWKRANILEVL